MKYDIFISYSRKDFEEVNRFVGMLKERIPSLTCWFDITGIESGDEFEDKIITAIDNSAYVLFALSDHSIQSQWTKDEVMYAKNSNSNKKVIPLLLKGAQLKGWFLFKFGRIDCIDTTNSLQIEKLVKNLTDWTGKATATADSSEHTPTSQKIQTSPSTFSGADRQTKKEPVKKDLHEAVDLGLSVKWATCNVGAAKPEECGGYFAWGETEEKDNYDWGTYKWCKDSDNTMTKYCCTKKYGAVDNKTVLDPEDDVAHVKWGGKWRMPTKEEFKELCEKCTWKWTTQSGVRGYLVTGPNGNSIFLPAAGHRDGSELDRRGSYGHYWSATLNELSSDDACNLYFVSGSYYWYNWNRRFYGHAVRPVTE